MRVILFGFMGSGKSTYGRKLAKKLNYDFIDLDHYIESKEKQSIKHIFHTQGEDHFRKIEHNTLQEILEEDNYVLATGGGTPCFHNNIRLMNSKGLTIYLKLDIKTLVSRLLNTKINRPLIWGKSEKELTDYIKKTLKKRKKYYKKAHLIVNAKDIDLEALKRKIESKKNKSYRW